MLAYARLHDKRVDVLQYWPCRSPKVRVYSGECVYMYAYLVYLEICASYLHDMVLMVYI